MYDALSALALACQARVPVILWGPPGTGKTSIIEAIARKQRALLVCPHVRAPEDVALPVARDGGVEIVPVGDFTAAIQAAEAGREVIVFVDEMSTLPPSVQAAVLRFLDSGRIGRYRLPPSVWRAAAANPPEQAAGGYDLAPPTANRVLHLHIRVDAAEWATEFPAYWGAPPAIPGIDEAHWAQSRALVASFIRLRPHLLLQVPRDEAQAGRAWPSPRTWDMASRVLAVCHCHPDVELALVAGCVGDGPALEFLTWRRELNLPAPEELLVQPELLRAMRGDQQYAALAALGAHLGATPDPQQWLAGWNVCRVAADICCDIAAATLARHLARTRPGSTLPPAAAINPYAALLAAAGVSLS